jgi:uncharacterized protein
MKRILLSFWLCASAVLAHAQGIKVVYHINSGIDAANAALGNIRNHLNAAADTKIVVVTHGPGIDFLVSDGKDSQGRIFSGTVGELANRGVEFRVCQNTLETRGINASSLLLEAQVVPSGVAEVARLQAKEGFVYLKP